MLYGYFAKEFISVKVRIGIVWMTVILSIFVALVTMHGFFTILESACALGGLWATLALSKNKEVLGWSLYVFMHFLLTYLTFTKGQYFFSNFQLASGIVAVCALVSIFIKHKTE